MTSRPSAQTRPPAAPPLANPTAGPGPRLPPRVPPVRSLSAAHLTLTTGSPASAKGGNGGLGSAGAGGADARQSDVVIDLTAGDVDGVRPESASASAASSAGAGKFDSPSGNLSGPSAAGSPAREESSISTDRQRHETLGRPKMRFIDGISASDAESATRDSGPTLPYPPRPGARGNAKAQLQQAIHKVQAGQTRKAKGIPSTVTLDPPQEARKYPTGKAADFDPWTGNRPEDHLSEKLIKHGFQSTPLVSLHDSNTARPLLWSNLKNKQGLQTLSNLFVSVLERRQQAGKLSGPGTFKPPPRVAMTDKNRESWLLELANPSVPLRKLSRRIPHGIRGKGLLEDCLVKTIPPPRAVWLAKCVGANEMRAFKRKGAGTAAAAGPIGEAKWLKEWTSQVQDFLESVVSSCGEPDWKSRTQYAIKLVTLFYSERFLDQDHYLDWILSNLEASSTERLPFWLLMTQIYWNDMVAIRRRGRRISEALLSRLQAISAADEEDICGPLVQKINQYLAVLIVKHRACLILPETWKNYKGILHHLAELKRNPVLVAAVKNISRRNDALTTTGEAMEGLRSSPRRSLLKALDQCLQDLTSAQEFTELSTTCLGCGLPKEAVMVTVLQWASTQYRTGEHRTYLVTRLLRKWKSSGLDIDTAILDFLDHSQSRLGVNEDSVFKIIAELCRSKHFSVGRYLQWLIASGILSSNSASTCIVDAHKRLLAELPMAGCPNHINHLRSTLLRSLDASNLQKKGEVSTIRSRIRALVLSNLPHEDLRELRLSEQTLSTKYELSLWVRQEVAAISQILPDALKTPDDKPTDTRVSTINQSQFCLMRAVLEDLGDLAILADITGICLTSQDTTVLASIADTLHLHARTFAAIGALGPLFKALVERYAQIRAVQPLERPFVFSLYDLATAATTETRLLQQLKLDLSRCEQRAAVAMCSPASDGMGEMMYSGKAELSTEEEIERVLGSGTNIDEPAAGRVFARIVSHMADQIEGLRCEDAPQKAPEISPFDLWLQKLRAFDERVFDRLMNDWITGLLLEQVPDSKPNSFLSFALPIVVGAGVAELGKSLDNTKAIAEQLVKIDPKRTSGAALNLLNILAPNGLHAHTLVESDHRYRFEIERRKLEPTAVKSLRLLTTMIANGKNVAFTRQMTELIIDEAFLAYMRRAAVQDTRSLAQTLQLDQQNKTVSPLQSPIEAMLGELLQQGHTPDKLTPSKADSVRRIISDANDFTIPFCQLQIEYLLNAPEGPAHADHMSDGTEEDTRYALLDAIKIAISGEDSAWATLLSGFGEHIVNQVREFAEEQILMASTAYLAAIKTEDAKSSAQEGDMVTVQRYVDIVDLTASNIVRRDSQIRHLTSILEKLRIITDILSAPPKDEISEERSTMDTLQRWINILVHLVTVHRTCVPALGSGEQQSFVSTLCSLLIQPRLQQCSTCIEAIFDVLSFVADVISPEVRVHISKSEPQRTNNDSRVLFLFGTSEPPEAWLGLVTSMSAQTSGAISTQKAAAGAAASPASPSPGPMQSQTQASRPTAQQPQVPTPGIQRQNSQQQLAQAQIMQRQSSQQRFQQGQPMASGHQANILPPKPGMQPMGRGGLTQYSQAPHPHFQARQVQQAWPPTQQNKLQQPQAANAAQRSVSMPNPSQPAASGQQQQQQQQQIQSQQQQQQQIQSQQQPAPGFALGNAPPAHAQQKVQFNPPVPYPFRRWEILPDASTAAGGPVGGVGSVANAKGESNDTAISLALFGARKVL